MGSPMRFLSYAGVALLLHRKLKISFKSISYSKRGINVAVGFIWPDPKSNGVVGEPFGSLLIVDLELSNVAIYYN